MKNKVVNILSSNMLNLLRKDLSVIDDKKRASSNQNILIKKEKYASRNCVKMYLYFLLHCDDKGIIKGKISDITGKFARSRRTIISAIKVLEDHGFIYSTSNYNMDDFCVLLIGYRNKEKLGYTKVMGSVIEKVLNMESIFEIRLFITSNISFKVKEVYVKQRMETNDLYEIYEKTAKTISNYKISLISKLSKNTVEKHIEKILGNKIARMEKGILIPEFNNDPDHNISLEQDIYERRVKSAYIKEEISFKTETVKSIKHLINLFDVYNILEKMMELKDFIKEDYLKNEIYISLSTD